MTIKSMFRGIGYSTDPTASALQQFIGRRDTLTSSEQREPSTTTTIHPLEELYPSLFPEPHYHTLWSDVRSALAQTFAAMMQLVRSRLLRSRSPRLRNRHRPT